MLCRNDDGVDFTWFHGTIRLLQVLDGDLRLAVWPQPPEQPTLADIGQFLPKTCRHRVRQGHAVFRLVARITKHDTLITSTNVEIVFAHVHTASDVWALLVDAHKNLA